VRARITVEKENPREEKVRVWLPFPKEEFQQSDVKLISASHECEIADNSVGQRTVYMEGRITKNSMSSSNTQFTNGLDNNHSIHKSLQKKTSVNYHPISSFLLS